MKTAAYVIEGNGTFAEDVPAFAELIKGSGAEVVLVPGTSRVKRAMPAAALRAGAEIDTNVVDVAVDGEKATVQRWAYRQRILTTFSRAARPWVVVTDPRSSARSARSSASPPGPPRCPRPPPPARP